jgi:hypothetical protein
MSFVWGLREDAGGRGSRLEEWRPLLEHFHHEDDFANAGHKKRC